MKLRVGAAFVACCLLSIVLVPADGTGPASAQSPASSVVAITKTVRGGTSFVPGQPFTYVLNYSCSSSVSNPCLGMYIEDHLPPELSWKTADVTFGGDLLPSHDYNETTGTVRFDKRDFQPATGQITITVKFPPGTAEGTEATNSARIHADNGSPPDVTSPPVTVRALPFSDLSVTKRHLGPAQLDTPVTYRVTATIAPGSNQIIRNARFVDELTEDGVTFVSATGGGTYDPSTNQVTWALGDIAPNQPAVTRDVTVIYPSSRFAGVTEVKNTVRCFGTPDGGVEKEFDAATDTAPLRAEGPIVGVQKTATTNQIGPGQSATYTLTGTAPADTDLTSLTITDVLPVGLVPVQDGAPNVSGTGPAPVVTAGAAVPVTAAGGGWSATVPASAATVSVTFSDVPAGTKRVFQLRAGIPFDGRGRDGKVLQEGKQVVNCADVSGEAPGTNVVHRGACFAQTVVPISVDFTKTRTTAQVVAPGGATTWLISLGVPSTSASSLIQPVITDCLPPGFDVPDPTGGVSTTGFDPAPSMQRVDGACPDGGAQLTWSWPAPFTLAPGQSGSISLTTSAAAIPNSYTNTATLTAENLDHVRQASAALVVSSTTLLVGSKSVKGDKDIDFVGAGRLAHTSPGGSIIYHATVQNVSAVAVTNLVLVDVLPAPGDTGVRSPTVRGSSWRPLLTGVSANGATISYSASSNPCRVDVGFEAPSCAEGWSASPPGGLDNVRAVRVDFGSFELAPNHAVTVELTMSAPTDASPGTTAWNSFAFAAQRADNGERLISSEPAEVGVAVADATKPSLSIVKKVNGQAATDPPGLFVPVGDPLVYTYEVTNTGNVRVDSLTVTDDVLGPIPCPVTSLAPGESMTCTAPTQFAKLGEQTNVGLVAGLALPVDADPNDPDVHGSLPVNAQSPEITVIGFAKTEGAISLRKRLNGQRAQNGVTVPPGQTIIFTYDVTNNGALPIEDVSLVDDQLGVISCPKTSLKPHEPVTCAAPPQIAQAGGQVNIATVHGQVTEPSGKRTGQTVTATDRASYTNTVVEPSTIVVTGSESVPLVALGGTVLGAGLGLTGLSRVRPRRRRAGRTR